MQEEHGVPKTETQPINFIFPESKREREGRHMQEENDKHESGTSWPHACDIKKMQPSQIIIIS